ncbi:MULTISPECIES: phage portal protein [Enterococcus]|jgi:SPP1 family phage portal protein|uniref:phage portal protein n=1 Tax=Enterococcus TaxID=1350 RepID=UPI001C8CD9DB|nr:MULTISPECIES: phage portal protein [Enterococcus]MBX9038484.1 phage portal protein [Enterococcus raffinosus]MDB1728583.1 phage portal protein [Enterococcus avium]MDB1732720.1 phage portal protein [Enterococcus avium]DAX04310.1 MAG TPA: PORTAL PROTEIN [Bacteriophage sp.]
MKDEFFDPPKVMTCDPSKEIDSALLAYYISKHKAEISRYEMLWKMYRGRHAIVDAEEKDSYKPDNRIVANFARYVVETFNGYFMGKPVTVSHEDPELSKQVNRLMKLNDQDDNNAELSKLVRIYGRAYEFLYQNENTETCITYNSPLDMFMVYDDTIAQRPFFAVRYYLNEDNRLQGEIYTSDKVYDFIQGEKGYQIINDHPHYYQDVPVIEYVNNDERQGIFEPVISMINAFNKALSEKANDVDYFADAYLAILGVQLDKDGLQKIRDNRIINFFGTDDPEQIKNIVVEFLQKPDGDSSQEHLLDRLEKLIYQMAMVTNLNSESFGNASGVGLLFKLQEMENLALAAERKFTSGMNRRFKMLFRLPTNVPSSQSEEWFNLEFTFHRNIPKDVLSEIQAAQEAAGLLPLEDRVSMVSTVKDPKATAEQMKEESGGAVTDNFSRIDRS